MSRLALFTDRSQAGRQLAGLLEAYRARPAVIVLGLPRGGVVVAAEVARILGVPLGALSVRKVGVPWQPELALGAVGLGGIRVVNRQVAEYAKLTSEALDRAFATAEEELNRREQAWRPSMKPADLRDRVVILVDDGLATGASARAAIQVARASGAKRVILAVPVGPADTLESLAAEADAIVAVATPEPFVAVGEWYEHFSQTTDDQVRALLEAG